jgi:hypothetical protein
MFFDTEALKVAVYLKRWYHWACWRKIEQMKVFARTTKRHWDGILLLHHYSEKPKTFIKHKEGTMRFSSKIKEYSIDLTLQEEDRWCEVIDAERENAIALCEEALDQLRSRIPGFATAGVVIAKRLFRSLYKFSGGLYLDEIHAWAAALDISFDDLLVLQCSYELAQVPDFINHISPLGCTAGITVFDQHGLVHCRTLDWGLSTFGKATRIFRFHEEEREFITVGAPGLIGVLSGMLPGAYTYEEAVSWLTDTPVSSNVFFTVCGADSTHACVIDRTPKEAALRRYRVGPLCQANHFNTRQFEELNESMKEADEYEDEDDYDDVNGYAFYADSQYRQMMLASSLAELPRNASVPEIAAVLDEEGVCNEGTMQKMVFCPKTSEYAVWRRTR